MRVAVLAAIGLMMIAALPVLGSSGAVADDVRVVVSHPGVVFHAVGSGDLRGQGVVKGLEEAQTAGYLPCQVCFGRVNSSPARLGAGQLSVGAAAARSTARVVNIGPGRNTGTVVTQPFGLKGFGGGKIRAKGSVRNPYDPVMTIRNPGKEAGAYGSDR